MYPVGSDQFEMIEYIQYYKERYTKIASKRSKNSNFPGPTKRKMYVRITVHRFGWKRLLSNLWLTHMYKLAMFISDTFTFAGFCEVIDEQESSMKSVIW
jgi:hypothetical protein